jgi:hypothetical protein
MFILLIMLTIMLIVLIIMLIMLTIKLIVSIAITMFLIIPCIKLVRGGCQKHSHRAWFVLMATQDEDDVGDDYNSLQIWNTTNNNTKNKHSSNGGDTTFFITRTLLVAKHTNSNIYKQFFRMIIIINTMII